MPIPRFIPLHPVPVVGRETRIPALRRGAGGSGARGEPSPQVTFTGRVPDRIPLPGSRRGSSPAGNLLPQSSRSFFFIPLAQKLEASSPQGRGRAFFTDTRNE